MAGDAIQVVDAEGRRHGWRRPVAIPEDVDAPGVQKAKGSVRLPPHLYWSGPERLWDLDNIVDLRFVYETVLTEGNDADVRWFIELRVLVRLWPDLYLPPHVREAWQRFLVVRRGVRLGC